jgi:arylsulfatase A-like enzyme
MCDPMRTVLRRSFEALLLASLFGALFSVGELTAARIGGGEFSFRWLPLLALYYVPLAAVFGAAAAVATRGSLWKTAWATYHAALLLEALLTLNLHVLIFTRHWLTPVRMAASGAAVAWVGLHAWLQRRQNGASPGSPAVAVLLGLTLSPMTLAAVQWTRMLPWRLRAFAFPLVLTAVSLLAVSGAQGLARLRHGRLAHVAAALLLLAGSAALLETIPEVRNAGFRDAPQPPPRATLAHPRRPNILLIVVDTLRARDVSCYGYARQTTPHIDALAKEAVLYTNSYSVSSSSLPGHASLFTGLYPVHHGAERPSLDDPHPPGHGYPLTPDHITLAAALAARGYATAGIVANFAVVGFAFGLDHGFRYYDARPSGSYTRMPFPPLLVRVGAVLPDRFIRDHITEWLPTPYRASTKIVDLALRWLDKRARPEQPFFLFLNTMDTHAPYAPRLPFRRLWWNHPGSPPLGGLDPQSYSAIMSRRRDATPAEREYLTALYDGALSQTDAAIGRLLDALKRRNLYDNTWIFLTSDHGESLGEHRTLGHSCSLYQEIVRVPLIVKEPAAFCPDRTCAARDPRLAQAVDLAPTILGRLGITIPVRFDGIPLDRPRGTIILESLVDEKFRHEFPRVYNREIHAIGQGRYQYIATTGEAAELYDVEADPAEKQNLAASQPELAAALAARLEAWERENPMQRPASPGTLSHEDIERLRSLGYLQ